MDFELMHVDWKDYIAMNPNLHKLTGLPLYYTINPENNRCVVWPSPPENIKLIARTE